MKNEDNILDWRSTGRRKARKALFTAYVSFECAGYIKDGNVVPCGKTTVEPPKDAPTWFDEIWPETRRVLSPQSLQADHETKDVTQNDIMYLNWRCASCHKLQDSQTEKGVATVALEDMFGTPLEYLEVPELPPAMLAQLQEIKYSVGMEEPIVEDDLWGG